MSRDDLKDGEMTSRRKETLLRYQRDYRTLKAELAGIDYVLQGSIMTRRMECGKPLCACHDNLQARHGPYYQWSAKVAGRTVSRYLDKEQAPLCRRWIENNRRFEKILKRMRALSMRVAALHEITLK